MEHPLAKLLFILLLPHLVADDHLLVPGERAGRINWEQQPESWIAWYALPSTLYSNNSAVLDGKRVNTYKLELYSDQPNHANILWSSVDDQPKPFPIFSNLQYTTDWHLREGITSGAQTALLEKKNGKPFLIKLSYQLASMEVASFNGGELSHYDSTKLRLILDAVDTEDKIRMSALILKDSIVSSDSKLVQDLDLFLSAIIM